VVVRTAIAWTRRERGATNNRQTNGWTSARFWTGRDIQRIPYMRGNFLAYLLDNQIRQASGNKTGLDEVIFRMMDRWVSAPTDRRPGVLENLKASYHDLLGSDDQLDAAIESYITQGEIIRLPANMFGECATIDSDEEGWQTIRLDAINDHQREVCTQGLP
jgi:predicted metalloprotease with PDZ domain